MVLYHCGVKSCPGHSDDECVSKAAVLADIGSLRQHVVDGEVRVVELETSLLKAAAVLAEAAPQVDAALAKMGALPPHCEASPPRAALEAQRVAAAILSPWMMDPASAVDGTVTVSGHMRVTVAEIATALGCPPHVRVMDWIETMKTEALSRQKSLEEVRDILRGCQSLSAAATSTVTKGQLLALARSAVSWIDKLEAEVAADNEVITIAKKRLNDMRERLQCVGDQTIEDVVEATIRGSTSLVTELQDTARARDRAVARTKRLEEHATLLSSMLAIERTRRQAMQDAFIKASDERDFLERKVLEQATDLMTEKA